MLPYAYRQATVVQVSEDVPMFRSIGSEGNRSVIFSRQELNEMDEEYLPLEVDPFQRPFQPRAQYNLTEGDDHGVVHIYYPLYDITKVISTNLRLMDKKYEKAIREQHRSVGQSVGDSDFGEGKQHGLFTHDGEEYVWQHSRNWEEVKVYNAWMTKRVKRSSAPVNQTEGLEAPAMQRSATQ
jgi:hypothetical protein